MNAPARILVAAALLVSVVIPASYGRDVKPPTPTRSTGAHLSLDRHAVNQRLPHPQTAPANETQVIGSWTFDGNDPEGWTSADLTAQTGTYWHVDDFAGLDGGDFGYLVPLQGSRSMWCGVRPEATAPVCGYAAPPGYGNDWDQRLRTTECLSVTGDVTVDYLIAWHSEPAYDWTTLEYDRCDNDWVVLEGGEGMWDDAGAGFFSSVIPDSVLSGDLRLRFRFTSDYAWSDEDGLWESDGAAILDSLTVRDSSGLVLPTETFDSEGVGETTTLSGAWTADVEESYGDFAALFSGFSVLQEDPCRSNLSYFWGFFSGSTLGYWCTGHPEQAAVPYENLRGQYIYNAIWSPAISLDGTTGTQFEITFDVYRDLDLEALIFYKWYMRSIDGSGCARRWRDDGYVYYGPEKEWLRVVQPIGDFVDPDAVAIQVALGVVDMCPYWCGFELWCHSHAPLFDNIEVRRVDTHGPQWSVQDGALFQDTFSADGTTTGTARIDAAWDILYSGNPAVRPGDSTTVSVNDPEVGLGFDPVTGNGPAAYAYVSVQGPSSSVPGVAYSDDAQRWPVVDSLAYGGRMWYCVRMDTVYEAGDPVVNRFCIDLNDNLFVPGDTIHFVFAAHSATTSYRVTAWSPYTGQTEDLAAALSSPAECTILPTPGRSILYVDGFDGLGAQPYFDSAFEVLGIAGDVDRYDVRAPYSHEGNHPGGRVTNPVQQLLPHYRVILWNTGDDYRGIGEGAYNEKSDDASMLLSFLDHLQASGGVYISGDHVAYDMEYFYRTGVLLRETYISHMLKRDDHQREGLPLNPRVVAEPGGCFDHVTGPDSLYAYAGCPGINAFDVLQPTGAATMAMHYDGGVPGSNGAVITQHTVHPESVTVGVVLSGVSYHNLVDTGHGGSISGRIHHLQDILEWLGSGPLEPVYATPAPGNTLSQNVPNPFNPSTTIEFTVRERAPVTLRIYNVRGQRVKTLVDGVRAPGIAHRIEWDGHNDAGQRVASGVYFYRLATKGYQKTRKMVLLK